MKNVLSVSTKPVATGFIASLLLVCACASTSRGAGEAPSKDPKTGKITYHATGNPYMPLWEHQPDSEPHVFEDPDNPGHYRIYITGSHDTKVSAYCGNDIRQWSAPVEDLSSWRDEGPIFAFQSGNSWDTMYAPDIVEVKTKEGKKEYYLYPNDQSGGRNAIAAKSDRPDGPFKPINLQPTGGRLLPGAVIGFDPAVFVDYITDPKDPDFAAGFRAYAYWGGSSNASAGELDPTTMYTLRPGTQAINRFVPSRIAEGENATSFPFFEASSMRKIGNKYVYIYAANSGREYGLGNTSACLRYAFGDSPLGPWKSGGVLVDARGVVPAEDGSKLMTTYVGHNTHGSIAEMNGQYYVFYHRAPRGYGYARQAMVAPIKIENDDKKVADGGVLKISAYDPFAKDNVWTCKTQTAEYTGAEVTSEGFQIFGLDPYQYYSAGIACFLSNPRISEDSYDMWDNNMPLAVTPAGPAGRGGRGGAAPGPGVQNGNIIGYKYFGFAGLDKDAKGVKAFEGAKAGNHTKFNLFLAPKSAEAFKINVWLDGPWDNATWKGKKLGEIQVPAGAAKDITQYTLDVSAAVEGLKEKHALFLVVEGAAGQALCDIIGLGFSSDKKKIVRPVPPAVAIQVNGEAIQLPARPVASTNANGIMGYDIYEATYNVAVDAAGAPKVAASASDPSVKVNVTQADSATGTAVVKFDYNGVVKTYRVQFPAR